MAAWNATPGDSHGARFHLLPATRLGCWSVHLLIAFAALFVVLFLLGEISGHE